MEKLPKSVESSKCVSHKTRILGEFESRKDFYSTKFKLKTSNIGKAKFY